MFCSQVEEVQIPTPIFLFPDSPAALLRFASPAGPGVCLRGPPISFLHSPGHLHCVLGQIDDPVDQVEGAERKREEDARVLVDDAGAGQNIVGRHGGALLQEGLGVDGRVGEGFCRSIKQRCRIHSFFEHGAGVHLRETERTHRTIEGQARPVQTQQARHVADASSVNDRSSHLPPAPTVVS